MLQAIVKKFKLGDGREVSIETGRLAKQAAGSVVVKMDDTMLLATVLVAPEANENQDFFPLTVEYKEKYSATGKFPGGFFKEKPVRQNMKYSSPAWSTAHSGRCSPKISSTRYRFRSC